MQHRARLCAAVAATAALLTPAAAAAPPEAGVLAPGTSLGGVRLGMTKADVRRTWGSSYGRCRDCDRETWYFNYRPFTAQGAGVVFERGRVDQAFTVWRPEGWRTARGLVLGAAEAEVTRLYGPLERRECAGYAALVLPAAKASTAFYVHEGELWGFGLTRRGESPCV